MRHRFWQIVRRMSRYEPAARDRNISILSAILNRESVGTSISSLSRSRSLSAGSTVVAKSSSRTWRTDMFPSIIMSPKM